MSKKKSSTDSEIADKRRKHDDLKEISAKQKPMPEIYTIPPKQPKEEKPGQLTDIQLQQFFNKVTF